MRPAVQLQMGRPVPAAGVTVPDVSVVVATCNQAATLPETLRSLRAQTLAPNRWELILIDDGSTDETAEILRHAGARMVRQENKGLPAGCNTGLRLARGRYFTRIDSDDFAEPDWLETLFRALEADPHAVCAVPDRREGEGAVWRPVQAETENLYSLIACGTLFRARDLRAIGGFRPLYWEEYDLYLRLRSQGRFLHVARPLYGYRRHAGGMTSNPEKRRQGWKELAELWGVETLRSAGVSPDLEQAIR